MEYLRQALSVSVILILAPLPAEADFNVEYQTRGHPVHMCELVFKDSVPDAHKVDALLSKALDLCVTRDGSADILAMAFHNDDVLTDGRDYTGPLIFRKAASRVLTWSEYKGDKTTERNRGDYFLRVETKNGAANNKYIVAYVVYSKPPVPERALADIQSVAHEYSGQQLSTTVYAMIGGTDRLRWRQIAGPHGKFINVEFDPKTRKFYSEW